MFLRILTLLIIIPLLELYILIKVGSLIGPFNTVMIVILTAFAGAYLTKKEGLRVLYQIRQNIERGIMPEEELFDGILIFIAGAMLLTPGFLTDSLGFLLLFPRTRAILKRFIINFVKRKIL